MGKNTSEQRCGTKMPPTVRRICWLIRMCLALPAWHPVRVRRLPRLERALAAERKSVAIVWGQN